MHVRSFCTVVLVALLAHCTVAEDLNVFLIPHSHCDPGWLNTFEGYFRDQVHRILNSVTEQLITDSTKKFVWAEISFFQLWYEQQSQDTRDGVKTLVKNGQLEFVAGGWVQNDEANANFDIVIDQVTEGHDFLHRVFGVVPRIAWQIDPFGHSSLTPSLFARMGFEALVINRIHFGLKASFKDNKNMEFLWTGSQSLGNASQLFTHVLHTHYSAPQGFDFEDGNPAISPNNAAGRARDLAETLKRRAHAYRTNNLLVPFGDDFKFQNAPYQFSNMDQLIAEINARRDYGVKIKYATVSEYFDAVSAASKKNDIKFPTYSGDFFPYADNDDSYWTGYYTTRPGLKSHSRGTDSILRAAEGMYALGRMVGAKDERFATIDWDTHFDGLRQGRRNAALVQHHDGITGTAKQFVANDYAQRLDQARSASHTTMKEMAQILLTDKETPSLTYDLRTFSFDLGDEAYGIVVHNPLGWIRRKYVKVRVTSPEVVVMSHDGVNLVGTQVLPVIDINSLSPAISEYELYFLVEVPPLGTKTYFLAKSASANSHPDSSQFTGYQKIFGNTSRIHNAPKINTASKINTLGTSSKIEIENEHYVVKFHGDTGLIASVYNKDKKAEVILNQEIADYRTSRSGAYIMRPERQGPTYTETTPIKLAHITGPTVSQVCTYFFTRPEDQAYETSVCVRLFSTRGITNTPNILEVGGYLEVVYSVVGRRNCETVVRFNTDLNTNRIFYTDNGLEIRERRSEGTRTENHYFPNLSLAYLQDVAKGIQFTILSRQAMGTHSRDNGVIEQMVHRALGQDDGRGLGEPNNDQSRIEVVVYLLVQPIEPSVRMARRLALALQHQPRLLHTEARGGPKAWATKYKPYYYPFVSQLPHNIHLLTFKARDSITDDIILRLIHIYEVGQHNQWSQPKELEWDRIFQEFTFDSKRERSLAMSLDMPALRNRKAVTVFLPSTETLNHASGVPPAFVKQENQNTEEEGVFISQAALDDKKKTEEETAKNQNPGGRTLQALTFTPEDTSLILAPMQIKSYFVQLVPKTTKAEPIPTIPPNKQLPPAETRATVPPKKPPQQRTTPKPKPIEKTNDSKEPPQKGEEEEEQTQVLDEDEGPVVIETNNGATMSNAQVSDVELRTFFLISIVGTGLVVLAYWRLRQRRNGKSSFTLMKRKGLIEV